MKNNNKNKIAAFALLSLSFLASATSAQASTLTYNGGGLGTGVDLKVNGSYESVFAGQLLITLDAKDSIAFCVDLFAPLSRGSYSTITGSPVTYTNGNRAAWIVENYGLNITTNAMAAAVQLALWEVVHDGGNGLGTGIIRSTNSMSSSLKADANSIIAASLGKSSNNATILYNTFPSGLKAQTLIVYTPPTSAEVPEPSSIAMLSIGVAGLGFGVYRKRKASNR
ncbi:hypothetical protein F183_A10810 [Bryobacterales bacterium F-183]|nr:hypothetical protein F183_A10810 [Bryobacterales bacterium F-183]